MMQQSNPAVIPRNHQVEAALEQAQDGDLDPFKRLLAVLQNPYSHRPEIASYQTPPEPSNRVYQTFCGT